MLLVTPLTVRALHGIEIGLHIQMNQKVTDIYSL
jgi:hypothetical protein